MLLYKSTWSTETSEHDTFKLLPVENNCVFNEVIFDPQTKILAVVGVQKKQAYRFVPKIDDKGRPVIDKTNNSYVQERKLMENFYEYYIHDMDDIKGFIKAFAINADKFDWLSYLEHKEK